MNEEVEFLHKNQTWVLVTPPKGQKVIDHKWIFKRKEDISGVADVKYKVRLVAKDFSQVEGIVYIDIFSPIVKHTSIRILLDIVAVIDLELERLNVKTIFLQGELEEQLYMHQPLRQGKERKVMFAS